MKKTRMKLILDYPFFGNLALTLKLIQDYSIPTLCTNGVYIKYNPKFVANLTYKIRLLAYMHEICHVILGHSFRRKDRFHELWNVACDYAVNAMLQKMLRIKIPEDWLYDRKYENMSAERIYTKLKKEFEKQIQQMQQAGNNNGVENGISQSQSISGQNGQDQGQGQQGQDQGQPDPNQNANAQQNPRSIPIPDPKQKALEEMVAKSQECGIVEDAPPDASEHEVQSKVVASHRSCGNHAGHGSPDAIREIIDEITSNKIAWQHLLANFLTESCNSRYDWMVPNHRYSFGDIIMPSLKARDAIKLVIAIDTSGSIDEDELKEFFAEVQTLCASMDYEKIHVVSCDTKIQNPKEFLKHEPIEYKPKGGGGTHAKPVWEWIAKEGLDPACVIYFTDLEIFSGFWGDNPGYPVLWIGRFYDPDTKVPFGEKVLIEDKKY